MMMSESTTPNNFAFAASAKAVRKCEEVVRTHLIWQKHQILHIFPQFAPVIDALMNFDRDEDEPNRTTANHCRLPSNVGMENQKESNKVFPLPSTAFVSSEMVHFDQP